jgi:hypothetical protein
LPITPEEAADIARRHGLTLNDAAGLLNLADDTEDADRIAKRFAETEDDPWRAVVADLFGRRDSGPERIVGDLHAAIDQANDDDGAA